jgi:hypothetical protein
MTYIIDAHEDIACAALSFNRNYLHSAAEIRKSEAGTEIPVWNNGEATWVGPIISGERLRLSLPHFSSLRLPTAMEPGM